MKIAFYCPNKPLDHPHPSGDLAIARSIRDSLNQSGHDCMEIVSFRARWFWKSPRGWLQACQALIRAARTCLLFRPNIWLTYHVYYKSPDVVGLVLARLFRIPYVLFQPMFATRRRKDPETRWGYYLSWAALRACTHAVTNNRSDLEALQRILPREKLSYAPPGLFPERFGRVAGGRREIRRRFGIAADVHLLLAAARLRPGVKEQSIRLLFEVVRELSQDRSDFVLLIAGDGPMEETLRQEAQGLCPGRILFVGGIPREEMSVFYSASDLFVFPGIGESLGMVYLEAQACGAPVVALRTPGAEQVVADGETGVLVEPGTARDMARVISQLLDDKRAREAMGKAGPAFIKQERNLHRSYRDLALKLEELTRGVR